MKILFVLSVLGTVLFVGGAVLLAHHSFWIQAGTSAFAALCCGAMVVMSYRTIKLLRR